MNGWTTGIDEDGPWVGYDGAAPLDQALAEAPAEVLASMRVVLWVDAGASWFEQLGAAGVTLPELRTLVVRERGFDLEAGEFKPGEGSGRAKKVLEDRAPGLQALSLTGHFGLPPFSHGGLQSLRLTGLACPAVFAGKLELPSLTSLRIVLTEDVHGVALEWGELRGLLRAKELPNLAWLDLRGVTVEPPEGSVIGIIKKAKVLPRLSGLGLPLDDDEMAALGKAEGRFAHLRTLALRGPSFAPGLLVGSGTLVVYGSGDADPDALDALDEAAPPFDTAAVENAATLEAVQRLVDAARSHPDFAVYAPLFAEAVVRVLAGDVEAAAAWLDTERGAGGELAGQVVYALLKSAKKPHALMRGLVPAEILLPDALLRALLKQARTTDLAAFALDGPEGLVRSFARPADRWLGKLVASGKWADAVALGRFLVQHGETVAHHYNYSVALMESGDKAEAIEILEALCEAFVGSPQVRSYANNNLANLYLEGGRADAALVRSNEACEADARNAIAFASRALVHLALGDVPAAVADMEACKAKGYHPMNMKQEIPQEHLDDPRVQAVIAFEFG